MTKIAIEKVSELGSLLGYAWCTLYTKGTLGKCTTILEISVKTERLGEERIQSRVKPVM